MSKNVIRVLTIEDDPQDYILIRHALQNSEVRQYETRHVESYDQAFNALLEHDYDVVLLDYFLGAMTGFDLLKHAQESRIEKPIIVMTGGNAAELDDVLIKAGAADFFPKDEISSSFLDRSIRHAIERKHAERWRSVADTGG